MSIPAACQSWAGTKAAYRFLSSGGVEAESLRAAHREKTIERLQGESCILVAESKAGIIPNADHNAEYTNAPAVNQKILEFLQGAES